MERVFLAQAERLGLAMKGNRWRSFTRIAFKVLTQGCDPLMQFGRILSLSPDNSEVRKGLIVAEPVTMS
jgi:hypothetical protein